MEQYKPGFLGKVIPADDPQKLKDFVQNKYDAFSKIYDTVKDQSAEISDIKSVPTSDPSSLAVKVDCTDSAMSEIKEKAAESEDVQVKGDTITAKS